MKKLLIIAKAVFIGSLFYLASSCTPTKGIEYRETISDTRAQDLIVWEIGYMAGTKDFMSWATTTDTISLSQMYRLQRNDFKFYIDSVYYSIYKK